MDYRDLVRSAHALESFFADSAYLGLTLSARAPEAVRLWRFTGLAAERAMYRATGGINTHKGAIFLLGLLAFSWGRGQRQRLRCRPSSDAARYPLTSSAVLDIAHRLMARPLADEQRSHRGGFSETYGQWAQRRFQWGGMRHTVLCDFRGLRRVIGLRPRLRHTHRRCRLALARHLLFLDSQDSNLLKRAGWRATQETLQRAHRALRLGSVMTPAGRGQLQQLDRALSAHQWSASGTGDLLAALLLLEGLERLGRHDQPFPSSSGAP